jgi:hypothetical protein
MLFLIPSLFFPRPSPLFHPNFASCFSAKDMVQFRGSELMRGGMKGKRERERERERS